VNTEFLSWSEREHQAHPRTHQRYAVSAKRLITFFGIAPLDAISSGHVEEFKVTRSEEISPAGVNRDLAVLRLLMLNLAIRQEHIVRNRVSGVVPSGKTKFARRNVPLTEEAARILKRRLTKAKGPYLFPHRRDPDKPITTVRKAHQAALRKASIRPPFRLYDLRHTFGSRSAMAQVDLPTLKELMGHSNISTTMRYVHPTPEHKREAVRKLERYNVDQAFALHERQLESPQKSPQ
jgi:integrase